MRDLAVRAATEARPLSPSQGLGLRRPVGRTDLLVGERKCNDAAREPTETDYIRQNSHQFRELYENNPYWS